MDALHTLLSAGAQVLSGVLPLSGAAQQALLAAVFRGDSGGPSPHVAVQVGLLVALLLYFRPALAGMAGGWTQALKRRIPNDESRLTWAVLAGSVPWTVARLLAGGRDGPVEDVAVAAAALAFALLLWRADARARQLRCEYRIRAVDVVAVGTAQVLALVPGVPHVGMAMVAGLITGLDRKAAARFALLLAIPALVLEIALDAAGGGVRWSASALAAAVAAVGAGVCIHAFLAALDRIGLWPFAVYQCGVCAALVWTAL